MKKLLDFLKRLEEHEIYYQLNQVRDAVMVEIAIPGKRLEAEFFADGHVEVETFVSNGEIFDESELEQLFESITEE